MVKVGKLWGDAKFASLHPLSKLLYCYLTTQPSITTLGVLEVTIEFVSVQLNMDLDEYYKYRSELEQKGYAHFIERDRGSWDTVVIVNHYQSLPKSKLNIRKAIDEGKKADVDLRHIFEQIFTSNDFEATSFTPPTPQQVSDYALSLGYLVNGKAFVDYYAKNDWYDKNDKKVRAWKMKVSKVWCREENKLQTAEGHPKGFEYFYVELEDGTRIYPESWRDGMPSHRNHIYAEYLIQSFNEQKDS